MIGIFDSGVGGMTVARAVQDSLPEYNITYFGDLARTPYGSKSPVTITKYSCQNTEFLLSKGAKLIIIACNSAASVASEEISNKFAVPVFEVITPAIEKAVSSTKRGRIGVIGTRATITSGIYEKKIKEYAKEIKVFSEPCPLLVPLVEEGWLNKKETKMILRRYLHSLKSKNIDTLVLGCTHYPLLKKLIQPRIGKHVSIIDSSIEIASKLKDYLAKHHELSEALTVGAENSYYVSDVTDAAGYIAQQIFGTRIPLINT